MSDYEDWELKPLCQYYHFDQGKAAFDDTSITYNSWCICIVEKGEFSYNIQVESGTCRENEILLCPPGKLFERQVVKDLDLHFFLLHWVDPLNAKRDGSPLIPAGKIRLASVHRLFSSLGMIKRMMGRHSEYHSHLRNHYFYDIWQLILMERHDPAQGCGGHFLTNDIVLSQALSFIQRYAFSKMSLEHAADYVNISHSQLTRKFKKAFNTTPIEYLTQLRLTKAKKLLINTDMKLSEVAFLCGFDNEYYFSRVFSRKMEESPSAFRQRVDSG